MYSVCTYILHGSYLLVMNDWIQVLSNAATYAINNLLTAYNETEVVSPSDREGTPSSPATCEEFVLDNDPDDDR